VRLHGYLWPRGTRSQILVPGDLVPARSVGSDLVVRPALSGSESGGSVFSDFVSRLRPYLEPPPPAELGYQAVAGVGMILISAILLWLFGGLEETVAGSSLLKWSGRDALASTMETASKWPERLSLFAIGVLLGIALIYWRQLGTRAALVFLTAQTWLGVAAFAVAVFVWLYALAIVTLNLVVWFLYIVCLLLLFAGALWLLGALTDG
jgi:hypothetical protein